MCVTMQGIKFTLSKEWILLITLRQEENKKYSLRQYANGREFLISEKSVKHVRTLPE